MRKWHRVAVPFVLFILYYSFFVLLHTLIEDSLIAMCLTNVVTIVLCLIHQKMLKPVVKKQVSCVGWIATILSIPVFWFLTAVSATYVGMKFPSDSSVIYDYGGWYVLLSVILAPIAEELLYRSVLFRHLREGFPVWVAYGVSAVVFALIHGTPAQIYVGVFCGLFFALLYDYTGRLLVSIAAHMLYNMTTILLAGLPLPDGLFKTAVVVPLNIILFAVLVAMIGYITIKPRTNDGDVVKQQSAGTNSIITYLSGIRQSFTEKISPKVGRVCKQYDDTVQLVLQTQEGACVYAGYVKDIRGNEYAEVRNRKIVRHSGKACIMQDGDNYVAYVYYVVM